MLARCIPCGSPWPRWLSLWTESLLCLSLSLCVSFFSVLLSGWLYVALWEDDLAWPKLNKIKRHRIFMFHKIIVGYQNFVTIDGILWLRNKIFWRKLFVACINPIHLTSSRIKSDNTGHMSVLISQAN
jgi:hypothetical protein